MTKKPHTKKANCNGNQMQMKLDRDLYQKIFWKY